MARRHPYLISWLVGWSSPAQGEDGGEKEGGKEGVEEACRGAGLVHGVEIISKGLGTVSLL